MNGAQGRFVAGPAGTDAGRLQTSSDRSHVRPNIENLTCEHRIDVGAPLCGADEATRESRFFYSQRCNLCFVRYNNESVSSVLVRVLRGSALWVLTFGRFII